MSGEASPTVSIGTPQRGHTHDDVLDAYTSKIGGRALYFRAGDSATARADISVLSKYFQCPQCKSTAHVSLLSQLYAPLEVYDRVLYILTCAACGRPPASAPGGALAGAPLPGASKKSGLAAAVGAKVLTSFCFALRSQNFSSEYFAELLHRHNQQQQQSEAARKAKAGADAPLFDEGDDDWGDDANDWGDGEDGDDGAPPPAAPATSPPPLSDAPDASSSPAAAVVAPPQPQPAFPLAAHGSVVAVKGPLYTSGLPLDLYVEPAKAKGKELSMEEQLAVAERMYGDSATVDTSGFEEDDETPAEEVVREYMEAMEANPSQCVRWCPGGVPLRTSLAPVGVNGAASPPPCPACGAPRQFEVQLTAPTVYFLTRDMGETKNTHLHFSNVLVYTCSKHCYTASSSAPYLPEYVVVEDEM